MSRPIRGLRPFLVVAVACVMAVGALVSLGPWQPAAAASPTLSAWNGGVDLYRRGTFTTQKSWLWCTAADVQIVRNIVDGQEDHTTGDRRPPSVISAARNEGAGAVRRDTPPGER